MRILLIEDDPKVADFLLRAMRAEGWLATHADDGMRGLELARSGGVDVVVLDVMLPSISGKDVCRTLRAEGSSVAVLMLTALGGVEDRVAGLRIGADDYLCKPFSLDELIARIEALGRRCGAAAAAPTPLVCGPISFDPVSLELRSGGESVEVTRKERELMRLFLSNPGRVFSRERILNTVWSVYKDPLTNVIDVYIARLRRKLGPAGDLIETVRGAGYRLRDPDAAAPAGEPAGRGSLSSA